MDLQSIGEILAAEFDLEYSIKDERVFIEIGGENYPFRFYDQYWLNPVGWRGGGTAPNPQSNPWDCNLRDLREKSLAVEAIKKRLQEHPAIPVSAIDVWRYIDAKGWEIWRITINDYFTYKIWRNDDD